MGPWFAGLRSYKLKYENVPLNLYPWKKQILFLLKNPTLRNLLGQRKVLWVKDPVGGSGKSTFIKYLCMNSKVYNLQVRKLLVTSLAKLRVAIVKATKVEKVDLLFLMSVEHKALVFEFIRSSWRDKKWLYIMGGKFNKAFLFNTIVSILLMRILGITIHF